MYSLTLSRFQLDHCSRMEGKLLFLLVALIMFFQLQTLTTTRQPKYLSLVLPLSLHFSLSPQSHSNSISEVCLFVCFFKGKLFYFYCPHSWPPNFFKAKLLQETWLPRNFKRTALAVVTQL